MTERGLRPMLVVPTYAGRDDGLPRYDDATLRTVASFHSPDLVIFPEAFLDPVDVRRLSLAEVREAVLARAREFACGLNMPVLAGVIAWIGGERGMQCAGYWNPSPSRGESESHFYAKHCTSDLLPYEMTDYFAQRDSMFTPIRIAGHRLGVQLCHDQFFGLVSNKLVRSGANVLVDLTGDSVVASKWRNIMAGRSREHSVPFFCTMTRNLSAKTNRAFATAFRDGNEIQPDALSEMDDGGDLVVIDSEGPTTADAVNQGLSASASSNLLVALHPGRPRATPDLVVTWDGVAGVPRGTWRDVGDVGVLVLSATSLRDPLCIHRHEIGARSTSKNVVCFVSRAEDIAADEAILLARLRAVEHRVAIVVCTPSVREVVKTSRYKNIQRIAERDGMFGLDGAFMKGTYASMAAALPNGIPEQHHGAYRRLLDESDDGPRAS